jgi:hypothetical protein
VKYRIVERHMNSGDSRFVPQRRFLWMWWDCYKFIAWECKTPVSFDNFDGAFHHILCVEQGHHVVKETVHELSETVKPAGESN